MGVVCIKNCLELNSIDLLGFSTNNDFVAIYKITNTIRFFFIFFIINNELYI